MDFYPTIVMLELTNECNPRCKCCYTCAGERENELTCKEIKRVDKAKPRLIEELYERGS